MDIILIIVLVIIVIFLIVTVIHLYNNLVNLRNRVKNSYSQIEVQLKRRNDLIPNLVETVKGYASHEKEVFENVTKARSNIMTMRSGRTSFTVPYALEKIFAPRPSGTAISVPLRTASPALTTGLQGFPTCCLNRICRSSILKILPLQKLGADSVYPLHMIP